MAVGLGKFIVSGHADPRGLGTLGCVIDMNSNGKSWLDLYVDAMMEKDPYKRLAMVRKLRSVQRQGESDEVALSEVPVRTGAKSTRSAAKGRRS